MPNVIGRTTSWAASAVTWRTVFPGITRTAQTTDDVFHQDDGPIDDQAKVDRAQAHEVARNAPLHHPGKREQHRERNRRGDDEAGAEIAEEHEQDRDDQQPALQQVVPHGPDDPVHQDRPIVVGDDANALGQRRGQRLKCLAGACGDVQGVLAGEHLHEADDRFTAAIDGRRSDAQHASLAHPRHVADGDRSPVGPDPEHGVLDVGVGRDQPLTADDVLLPVVLDVPAARVLGSAFERLEDLAQAELVRHQLRGIDNHLVLLRNPAPGVDFGHPGHRSQARCDLPVEDGPALHRRHALAFDGELKDVPQPCRDRAHLRGAEAFRDGLPCLLQTLRYQLAGKIDVDPVFEHDGDRREAIPADRTDLHEIRQAIHRRLNGVRDELLHLGRSQGRGLGEHLHLYVGDVGHDVEGQVHHGDPSADDGEGREDQDDGPILE